LSDASAPRIIVLTAPSGSGKTTIAHALLDAIKGLRFSVSATTRVPRSHEKDGVHYHFLSAEQFEQERRAGRLVEYEEVYPGRFYGTLMSEVERSSIDEPVLLDIDVRGASNAKRIYGDLGCAIFIRPPSLLVLAERLEKRQTESKETLQDRLDRAQMELTFEDRFDHKVVNDSLEKAIEETLQVVTVFLGRSTN